MRLESKLHGSAQPTGSGTRGRSRTASWAPALVIAGAASLAWACESSSFGLDMGRFAQLENSRTRWEAAGIRAYRIRSAKSCFCPTAALGWVEITVEDGVITSVERQDSGPGADPVPEEHWSVFDTVEDLFDLVESAIESGAYSFEVEYDLEYGHPVLVSLDYQEHTADDEVTIEVAELVVLKRD